MNNDKILTLGIFAHANAGKTTITENLLYSTGVIKAMGRVDTGNTVTDSMGIEQKRGITIRSSLVSFKVGDTKVQLIDTPGHVDFSAEVERAISVLDGAVLVISAVEGIESQTYTIWKALRQKNIPTIFYINKMDRAGADFDRVLKEIREKLNANVVPMHKIKRNDDGNLEYTETSKEELIECLGMQDSEILNKYIEKPESVSLEEVKSKIYELSKEVKLFIAIGGSALKSHGIEELIESINMGIPTTKINIEDKCSAYVYTVKVDKGQRKTYVKLISGKLKNRSEVETVEEGIEKVKGLYISNGIEVVFADEVYSGEIAIITGINVECGQILGEQRDYMQHLKFVKPLIKMQISAKDNIEITALIEALKILNAEDPYLNVRYSKNTREIYISLMGEVQAQVIEQMLKERFEIEAILSNPIIIHKETPSKQGTGKASYTRVSEVEFEVNPLPRGSGFIYRSKLSTDLLHKKYQRQAQKLINQYSKQGIYGWEVTDAEVNLVGGRFDSMGSEPKHFNIAIPIAFMRALKDANMKVLEPICNYSIVLPKECYSDIAQRLASKNGIFRIVNENREMVTIDGEAPIKLMINFPLEVTEITSGRGVFSSSIDKYELSLNQNIQNKYIGEDPRNEVIFVIKDMNASLDSLDPIMSKKKKPSRAKFKRRQEEKKFKNIRKLDK